MSKIAVIGSLNMDLVIKVPYAPAIGETVVGREFETIPGGKGANQAAACARLGAEVAIIGRVGRDEFGASLTNSMQGFGVDTSGLISDTDARSGIAMIMVAAGDNMIAISEGANANVSIADIDAASHIIDMADIILLQFEIPMETVEYIIGKYKATKKIFLDPAPFKQAKDELLNGLYTVLPNENEAEKICDVSLCTIDDIFRALEILKNKGVKYPIITLGSKGVAYFNGCGYKHIEACCVSSVDTTAAGDTFAGALASAILKGDDIDTAVTFASAAAALATCKYGAQTSIPTKEDVDRFMKDTLGGNTQS